MSRDFGTKLWIGLSITVSIIYISVGLYVLVNLHRIKLLSYNWQLVLGIALIGYGIFRGYRSMLRYKVMTDDNEE